MRKMSGRVPLLALLGAALLALPGLRALITDENEAKEFMKELDVRYSQQCNQQMVARWDYITDVTNTDKEEAANAASVQYMTFQGEAAVNCSEYDYSGFIDIELYRRFRFLSKKGPGALQPDDLTQYKALQANMETIYSTATICDYHDQTKCDLILEPDIEAIMASSEDWDELRYTWEQWRENTGKLMRDDFVSFVELSNQAAVLDGFDNTGSYWLSPYTVDTREAEAFTGGATLDQHGFRDMADSVWQEVSEQLYKKLHAYVRMRLQEVYVDKIDPTGPIPSHILGDMWAQDWSNIARHVMPFPEMPTFDVTNSMVKNGWDIQKMFLAAEDFFRSIDLFDMTQTFWDKSVINQTAWGKIMLCHASAEDFCLGPEGDDYRIKMCTEVNMVDLVTVHHEMGHIEYFMAYKNEPLVFRDSANPGFHEAIGDLIALSMSTPKHLEEVLGLTPDNGTSSTRLDPRYTDDEKRDLNFLMKMALEKIAFLPFGYLIDNYRWGVFDGSIPFEELNAGWWNLRESLQGVTPPAGPRGEEYFDPGAKYHVPANVPYIRYFVSFIVQFQFHAHLCEAAGHTGPLHTCDIYNNTAAGDILRSALEKGFSEPWPKVLGELGGSTDMSSQPIIDYFAPLIQYLDQALLETNQCIGWGDDCSFMHEDEADASTTDSNNFETTEISSSENTDEITAETSSSAPETTTMDPRNDEELAQAAMEDMNANMTQLVRHATEVDWLYYTDVSDDHAAASNDAWITVSQSFNAYHESVISYFNYSTFNDSLRRQFQLQKNLGTAALNDTQLTKLNEVIERMTSNYTSRVCPVEVQDCNVTTDGLSIDQLEQKMSTEKDYDVLEYYWEAWRNASGRHMKDDYITYIELLNEAADRNGFPDAGQMWVEPYTDEGYGAVDFQNDIEVLWNATRPLYEQLHAYVLDRLKSVYTESIKVDEKFIPAHVLGNMWAQSWENIYDLVKPYEDVDIPDISDDLNDNIVNVTEMFCLAENFFTSLNLYTMTPDFWSSSLFKDPNNGTEVICHASAWDFYDTENVPDKGRFRIKMCANTNQEDLIVIHHEMGHTEYQMSYSTLDGHPLVFRDGANPGFHEAIGDTIALSVSTPRHLQMISDALQSNSSFCSEGFMLNNTIPQTANVTNTTIEEQNINFLMKTALAKIAFIPYAYILDKWRWDLFADHNNDLEFNKKWWALRLDIQGISPPVERFPSSDFDPGSKYHVATNVPYIRYFVAYMLQFQFHERLCSLVHGENVTDIFNCDIYNSKEAGAALQAMLRKGASEGWHSQLREFLDNDSATMTAEAILNYFQPLSEFLSGYIASNAVETTWPSGSVGDYMKSEDDTSEIPPIVPIVVGAVLAVMVIVVIIAYFVGRSKQKKKEREDDLAMQAEEQPNKRGEQDHSSEEHNKKPGEVIEMAEADTDYYNP
nr:angiotensin-converting enzyme-like [Procambarus clarkii]